MSEEDRPESPARRSPQPTVPESSHRATILGSSRTARAASPADNREHPRLEVTAYVDFTGSEVLLYHRIENISLGGICLQTSYVEELGTVVDLLINFPELDASVVAHGEVAWVNREPPMDMGIRFIDLDEARKAILRRYLDAVRKRRA